MNYTKSNLRRCALLLAIPASIMGVLAINTKWSAALISHGPIQNDHKEVACISCHLPAKGTMRQQIQANVYWALAARENRVNFGFLPVTSQHCIDCHARPNDRHPIYRFNEPRFSKARKELNANSCLGCHSEHENKRASTSTTFCSSCHTDLELKNDPLDQSHVQLVDNEAWETCLGCHDFHGNHKHQSPLLVDKAISTTTIQRYLEDGPDPYSKTKLYEAKIE